MSLPAKLRILVVDNEPAFTRLVRLTLEKHGVFEVCEVNDPTRAVSAAQRFQPGLVLLDVEMPSMDGGEVAQALRAHQRLSKVPIVFMTSLITEVEATRNVFCNGSRVLAKPVTVAKLVRCVGELLNHLCCPDGSLPSLGSAGMTAVPA